MTSTAWKNECFYPEGVECEKCKSSDVEAHHCTEVAGQAVDYTIYRCQNCEWEWYKS